MEVAATLTITESPDGEITASWKTEKTNLEHLSKMREALLQIAENQYHKCKPNAKKT